MPIRIECDACQKVIRVKEEYAGRRIRCPGCQTPVTVPDADDEFEELPEYPPRAAAERSKPGRSQRKGKRVSKSDSPWYLRHWHWLVVGIVLLLAPWPTVGFRIAALVALVGALMALMGGLFPFIKVIVSDPVTVMTMIASRSARFRMMDQPDDHPYKVLVRTAFNPTRKLFWRGVLLLVAIVPAAFLQGAGQQFFAVRAANQAAPPPPQGFPPVPDEDAARMHAAQQHHHPALNNTVQQNGADDGPAMPNRPQPWVPPHMRPGFAAQPSNADQRESLVTITLVPIEGDKPLAAAVSAALSELPQYVENSAEVDETAGTVRFRYQGRVDPNVIGRSFAKTGYRAARVSASSSPSP